MRAVVFTGAGGNEVVDVQDRPDPVPGVREVLVEVRFAGLNPADSLQRSGRYPAPPGAPADIPGLEVCGTVLACGVDVTRWKPGDRVFGLTGGGGLASRVAVDETNVTQVPDPLGDREAAGVPEVFITAHDAVVTQCGLSAGETLLVHGAGGGVGTAACQIAKEVGASALAVVRSDAAAETVTALGADAVRDETFVEEVEARTQGRGVDVILELVGAPHFPGNLSALAPRGRIVIVGVASGAAAEISLFALMQRRASIRGTVLRPRPVEEKALAVDAFAHGVVPGLAAGRMQPVIDSVFPVEQARDAFARLDGRGKAGKVILEFP
jgi:putative PIG3 family NAD(P)H quinone oxidoreductase